MLALPPVWTVCGKGGSWEIKSLYGMNLMLMGGRMAFGWFGLALDCGKRQT